ncbi:HipA N-terminal domain-containing protein [uncultured Hymenobacter sp.]|uniref:HipA N-terminal domain-containing protein n=1 Tax=uncultured Hymenobacter sp. TaxID=170016 RepID=UPI0035CA4C0B
MKTTLAEVFFNGMVAGVLSQGQEGFTFRYDADYLASAQPPISLTLPKQTAVFRSPVLFAFFFGLLAEGTAKEIQCRDLLLNENDHFTRLLRTAHSETIGAVTVRPVAKKLL